MKFHWVQFLGELVRTQEAVRLKRNLNQTSLAQQQHERVKGSPRETEGYICCGVVCHDHMASAVEGWRLSSDFQVLMASLEKMIGKDYASICLCSMVVVRHVALVVSESGDGVSLSDMSSGFRKKE